MYLQQASSCLIIQIQIQIIALEIIARASSTVSCLVESVCAFMILSQDMSNISQS